MRALTEKEKRTVLNYLIKKLHSITGGSPGGGLDMCIDDNIVTVEIGQMYEFFPVNFESMDLMANLFGSKKIDTDEYSHSGCETCDYGSSYVKKFIIKEVDITQLIKNISVLDVMTG